MLKRNTVYMLTLSCIYIFIMTCVCTRTRMCVCVCSCKCIPLKIYAYIDRDHKYFFKGMYIVCTVIRARVCSTYTYICTTRVYVYTRVHSYTMYTHTVIQYTHDTQKKEHIRKEYITHTLCCTLFFCLLMKGHGRGYRCC